MKSFILSKSNHCCLWIPADKDGFNSLDILADHVCKEQHETLW